MAPRNRFTQPRRYSDLWKRRDLSSGRFTKAKASKGSFKGVKRER